MRWRRGERVAAGEGDATGRERFGAREREDFLVVVGGEDGGGGRRDELRPVAGAARDLVDMAAGEERGQTEAEGGEIGLA